MKKLTDVYIKVTKQNYEDCGKLFKFKYNIGTYIIFLYNDFNSYQSRIVEPKDCKKVSLAELKRLIDTTPTREEIRRLKQQISGYKTNLSLTNERCKELQSDNESLIYYKDSLKESRDKWIALGDKLEKENDNLKQILKAYKEDESILLDSLKNSNDTNMMLEKENEQLKNRKWWQLIKF